MYADVNERVFEGKGFLGQTKQDEKGAMAMLHDAAHIGSKTFVLCTAFADTDRLEEFSESCKTSVNWYCEHIKYFRDRFAAGHTVEDVQNDLTNAYRAGHKLTVTSTGTVQ
jgi:hypothetical protein